MGSHRYSTWKLNQKNFSTSAKKILVLVIRSRCKGAKCENIPNFNLVSVDSLIPLFFIILIWIVRSQIFFCIIVFSNVNSYWFFLVSRFNFLLYAETDTDYLTTVIFNTNLTKTIIAKAKQFSPNHNFTTIIEIFSEIW